MPKHAHRPLRRVSSRPHPHPRPQSSSQPRAHPSPYAHHHHIPETQDAYHNNVSSAALPPPSYPHFHYQPQSRALYPRRSSSSFSLGSNSGSDDGTSSDACGSVDGGSGGGKDGADFPGCNWEAGVDEADGGGQEQGGTDAGPPPESEWWVEWGCAIYVPTAAVSCEYGLGAGGGLLVTRFIGA